MLLSLIERARITAPAGVTFSAVLDRFDARKAHVGDSLRLKLREEVSLGVVVIPKDAVLVATVRELHIPADKNADQTVSIVADRAAWDRSSVGLNAPVVLG